jgi:N utilization substance protein A
VQSRDRDVDSVGACVGMKGMRVQSIIRELRGEKIDIIEYSDDPVGFATHALSPAKISRVAILDPEGKHMEVIVDDTQLSLAIGKKGQNVRLAAKLLGWKVDIKSEEEKRQEVESQMAALVVSGAPVSVLIDSGLTDKVIEKLIESGVGTVEQLGSMTPEQLEEIPGVGPKTVEAIQLAVNSYYAQYEEPAGSAGESAHPAEAAVGALPATDAGPDRQPEAAGAAEGEPQGGAGQPPEAAGESAGEPAGAVAEAPRLKPAPEREAPPEAKSE